MDKLNINSEVIDVLNDTLDQSPYYIPITWEQIIDNIDKEELSHAIRKFCKKPTIEWTDFQNFIFGEVRKHLEHCRKVKEQ